jgi:hypothetical protein
MASRVDALAAAYGRHVAVPWTAGLSPPERVWFVVYPKEEERRLRYKIQAFHLATAHAAKKWIQVDLTDCFARWLDGEKYRDSYFKNPKMLAPKLPRFLEFAAGEVVEHAKAQGADEETVVAVVGAASLFGFAHVSELVPRIAANLPGRLLVFFPGTREGNAYKLLDAREGWNYLATSITASATSEDGSAQ